MHQVLLSQNGIGLVEVPEPMIGNGDVLVKVAYSAISPGTEMASVARSGQTILQKSLSHPSRVITVMSHMFENGAGKVLKDVMANSRSGKPLGYSCSGVAVEVGGAVNDIKQGQRVACGGTDYACHAEYVRVPQNLCVQVPDNLELDAAATVSIGAIALQGVRRSGAQIGETIAIIGLGLIGQITMQLLKATGCKVIGFDIDDYRIKKALELGMDGGCNADTGDPVEFVRKFTGGNGVDVVLITAATSSSKPLNQAMQMCRKKGKVVIVGAVGMELERSPFYEKEIDLLISCSYGPGRYDPQYEEYGLDYPFGYVRWTENRNMQAYLELLSQQKIQVMPFIEKVFDFKKAPDAYDAIKEEKLLGVLLRYESVNSQSLKRRVDFSVRRNTVRGRIRIGLIGCGSFAKNVHLPNLEKLSDKFEIASVCSATGTNARNVASRYSARYCTTDYRKILEDQDIDAVLITTRHNLHAKIAIAAAEAGKAIFLEKPMATSEEELDALSTVLDKTGVPFMVGFNRRYSPIADYLKKLLINRQSPLVMNYVVNAGFIPYDAWVHTEEGGGRIIGESCHMVDLLCFFAGSLPTSLEAASIREGIHSKFRSSDNLISTVSFSEGSIASLVYTSMGNSNVPKEKLDIYCDGEVFEITDFKLLNVNGEKKLEYKNQEKGHIEILKVFSEIVTGKREYRGYKEADEVTRVTLKMKNKLLII